MKSNFPNLSNDEQHEADKTVSDEADSLDSVVSGYSEVVGGLRRIINALKGKNKFLEDSNRVLKDRNEALTEENEALAEECGTLRMAVKERELDQQRQQQLSQASDSTPAEDVEALLANELNLAEGALPEVRLQCFAKTCLFLQLSCVSLKTKQRIKDLLKDIPHTAQTVSITNFTGSYNGPAQIDTTANSPLALK